MGPATIHIPELLRERILPALPELAKCRSTYELEGHPLYRSLESAIRTVLESPERGDFRALDSGPRPRYRILAWNIERGAEFEGQVEALRRHEYLQESDVLLLTEADAGMARSGNREVAREMAEALGFAYVFVPCYLNFGKGSGMERRVEGENLLALHGNAILSRYPIGRAWRIPLMNGIDKIASREKRLGRQAAVAAEIDLPGCPITAVSIHLDAQSSQRHRNLQMQRILEQLDTARPVVLGGDWNTSTYNSSRALHAILGFWLRVFMGVDNVIRNHYLHPYRRFERDLFDLLVEQGFDYRGANRLGEHTTSYFIDDPRAVGSLAEWVPRWCFAFIRWALRNHGGRCPLKLDWFATRGVRVQAPVVLHEFREGREVPLSDHDPIGIDILP